MKKRWFTAPLLVGCAAVAVSGCYVSTEEDYGYMGSAPSVTPGDIFESSIDPGASIETTPGDGAGVFVEYETQGRWRVFVSCDSNLSGSVCAWDVTVSSAAPIDAFDDETLEADDALYHSGRRTVILQTYTDFDLDGFSFETAPGEAVRVQVWIDGVSDPRFLYWVGDGALHRGAPSNPLDLVPGPE